MGHDSEFERLWNDFLEGDLEAAGIAELHQLIADDETRLKQAGDSYQLHRLLGLIGGERNDGSEPFVAATMAGLPAADDPFVDRVMQRVQPANRALPSGLPWMRPAWVMAAIAAVFAFLLGSLFWMNLPEEREIATITGLSGSLLWTGDGGRVGQDLRLGTELIGGTIEGLAPDSWAELQFHDGSTVTISGRSVLTFSDREQKELHLREGNVSAQVAPQPAGKPMLIHTRSATLEVLGTKFRVEAGLASTMLNVSSGRVRVKRLSDDSTIDVPAQHRVVAAADRVFTAERVPEMITRWRSELALGPADSFGQWAPATDQVPARLGTIPFVISRPEKPESITLYLAAMPVSRGDNPPVTVHPETCVRVRGRTASSRQVILGVTMNRPDGPFAGKFLTWQPASEFAANGDFELIVPLRKFGLDPSLAEFKAELPSSPTGLVVADFWCCTLNEQAGLEITEVEFWRSDADQLATLPKSD